LALQRPWEARKRLSHFSHFKTPLESKKIFFSEEESRRVDKSQVGSRRSEARGKKRCAASMSQKLKKGW
jgi:hypothetical protein